jgi:diguanylate cyclase (GGDEF)-like protein/PAS domain S-box-containing protein
MEIFTELQRVKQQLRAIQRVAHIGIWELRIADSRVTLSDEICRLIGIAPDNLHKDLNTFLLSVHPEDRQMLLAAFEQAWQGKSPLNVEHRIVRPDGEVRHVQEQAWLFSDDAGPSLLWGTMHDITERKDYLERLQKSETLLQVASRMARIGGWMIELSADRVIWSDQVCEIHEVVPGTTPTLDEAIAFYTPEGRDTISRLIDTCIRDGTSFDAEAQIVTAKGHRVWVRAIGQAMHDANNTVIRVQGAFQDITGRKQADQAIRESEERFKSVAGTISDVIWDWNLKSDRMWWSEGMQTLFGFSPVEIEPDSTSWTSRVHPEDRERVLHGIHAFIDGQGKNWSAEYRFRRKDGSFAYVLDRAAAIRGADGNAVRLVGAMADLSEIKQVEEKRKLADARIRQQASLLDKAQDAIVVRSIDHRILYWNKSAERLYGWSAEDVLGKSIKELAYDNPFSFNEATDKVLKLGEWRGEILQQRKDGSMVTVEAHWTLVRDDDGYPQSILSINTDITQRKSAEEKIQRLAFYDPLTHLPNRVFLLDRLQHALATSARSSHMGALMFIDLDNFKTLNDTLGHDKGDLLLQQVAERLTSCVRETDTVARLGGDEFVVMLEELGERPREAAIQAKKAAEKILACFNQPFHLAGYEHYSTPSIGITLFKGHEDLVDEILKRADLAMYQAKAAGRNTVRFFDPKMQAAVTSRAILEADLREGSRENQFRLYYQPQVEGQGHPTGAEALVRWQHPRRGLISPAEFIPLAEETGLILILGQWVLETACAQLAAWAASWETAHLNMAVNVSVRQFRHPDFVEQVLEVLSRSGANPQKLKLELTESLLVTDMDVTIAKMAALKDKGVSFSLDDFGTGYSSLSYLKRMPLDQLKIDQSFVRDVLTDPNDATIARAIVALGQSLGLSVMAEGVETEAQRCFLAQHGCHAYQGYLFNRPLPINEFDAFMVGNSKGGGPVSLH